MYSSLPNTLPTSRRHESHLHLATEKRHTLTIFGCCIHIQHLRKRPFWSQHNTTICVDSHGIIYLFFGVKVERCQTRESTKNTWGYQKRTRMVDLVPVFFACLLFSVFMDFFQVPNSANSGFRHFWLPVILRKFWGFFSQLLIQDRKIPSCLAV